MVYFVFGLLLFIINKISFIKIVVFNGDSKQPLGGEA